MNLSPVLTRLTLLFSLLFAGVIGALHLQPYRDPVLDTLSGCRVACWQGVEPGLSIDKASLDHLNADYGSQPSVTSCIDMPSNFCNRFSWRSADALRATEVMVNHDRVQSIMVVPPGFTLGEALLALDSFHTGFYGASPATVDSQHFNFQLVFDQTRIGLSMTISCPASYFVMMQTPVRNLNVGTPTSNTQGYFLNSFAAVRRIGYQQCEL